jgi:hypothetical protein
MTEWKWFVGEKKGKEVNKKPIDNDYYKLAKDPIPVLTKDPELLFKVVDFTTEKCMCGGSCGSCCQDFSVDVQFIDLIIQYKSIKESDLVKLPKLNWFKITSHLPLSIPTLEKYIDRVDWKYISSSYLYEKNDEFIRKFHKHLNMKSVYNTKLTEDEACKLIFEDKILPLHTIRNIPMNLMLSKVKANAEYIGSSIENTTSFTRMFGAKETEETYINNSGALKIDSKDFADKCCSDKYVPKTKRFIDILKKGVNWSEFLLCCKPNIEFIEAHIVPGASKNTWHDISACPQLTTAFIEKYISHLEMRKVSQHYQFDTVTLKKILGNWNTEHGSLSIYTRLTPEFIDEYADKLDWYNLCEHQVLPEWLLNKHKDKINWGQVSLYQTLTQNFIEENRNMLNEVKLRQNKEIKHINMFL